MLVKAACTVLADLCELLLFMLQLSDLLAEDDGHLLRLAPTRAADAMLSHVVTHRAA